MNTVKLCPVGLVLPLQILRGMTQFKAVHSNLKLLNAVGNHSRSIKLLALCGHKHVEFINEYVACRLDVLKEWNSTGDALTPIVVCVVKNDLIRMQLVLDYYRKIGVTQFAILDDHSTDGTREFLAAQHDVMLFVTEKPYTTVRRQVWLNKIIEYVGRNRWYLVVDSDELFDYKNSDYVSIKELTAELAAGGKTRVKALLLDMFSSEGLYNNDVSKADDVVRVYNLFLPEYELKKGLYDDFVRGGARGVVFKELHTTPVVSKYPLIYIDEKDILLNSHYYFPYVRNKPKRPSTVLRHYKFLPSDKSVYQERAKIENFAAGSKDYKAYSSAVDDSEYKKIVNKMIKYIDFDSVKAVSIMDI